MVDPFCNVIMPYPCTSPESSTTFAWLRYWRIFGQGFSLLQFGTVVFVLFTTISTKLPWIPQLPVRKR